MANERTPSLINLQSTYTPLFISQILGQVSCIDSSNVHHNYPTFTLNLMKNEEETTTLTSSNNDNNNNNVCSAYQVRLNRCCILGYITCLDTYLDKKITITLDDGTAAIKCVKWLQDSHEYQTRYHDDDQYNNNNEDHNHHNPFSLGQMVEIRGRLHIYRGFKQIIVEQCSLITSHLQEAQFWLHCVQSQQHIIQECEQKQLREQQEEQDNHAAVRLAASTGISSDEDEEWFGKMIYKFLLSETRKQNGGGSSRHFSVEADLLSENCTTMNQLFQQLCERKKVSSMSRSEKISRVLRILNRLLMSNHIINVTPQSTTNTSGTSISNNASSGDNLRVGEHSILGIHSQFQMILLKEHLVPAVDEYMRQRQSRLSDEDKDEGIPLSFIVKGIQSMKRFSKMSPHMIRECVEFMVNESVMYETMRPHCYKIIDNNA